MALWCLWERCAGKSVQCKVCINWIHKRCSGVCGDLSLVAHGFRYKRCDGTIQEADLAGDLVVDGETYGCVKSFCYMGDTLDGDGRVELAATARIRNGLMKFWNLLPFLTSRAPPLEMKGRVMSSSCHQTIVFHLSTQDFAVSLNFERSSSLMTIFNVLGQV